MDSIRARHKLDQEQAKSDQLTAELFCFDLTSEYLEAADFGAALALVREQPRAAASLLRLVTGRLQCELSISHLKRLLDAS